MQDDAGMNGPVLGMSVALADEGFEVACALRPV